MVPREEESSNVDRKEWKLFLRRFFVSRSEFFISLEDSAQHNRVISDTPGYFKVLTPIACSKQYKCEGSYRIRKDSHCEGCDKCFSALSDTVEVNGRRFSVVFLEKPWDALCTSSSPLHI